MNMYAAKAEIYFGNARTDAIGLLPAGPLGTVLEIGCGNGATLAYLKQQQRAERVVGVDAYASLGADYADYIDEFHKEDIGKTLTGLPTFDVILALDVLEHLVDPWMIAQQIASKLNTGGLALISLPNIRHWTVLRDLVFRGRWTYQSEGILDRTHLRFFVRGTAERMLIDAGLDIEQTVSRFRLYPHCRTARIDRMTFGVARDFLTTQYVIVGRKQPSSGESDMGR